MDIKLQKHIYFDEPKSRRYWTNVLSPDGRERINPLKRKTFSQEEKIRIVIDGQSNVLPIEDLCAKEGINLATFENWTKEFLSAPELNAESIQRNEEDKFRIVIEGKTGITSVAEICRREKITQDIFLEWCEECMLTRNRSSILQKLNTPLYKKNHNLVKNKSSKDVVKFLKNYIDLGSLKSLIVSNSDQLILDQSKDNDTIISLEKINNSRFINKYLELVNSKLDNNGIFVGCLETFSARKERLKLNRIPLLNNIYFSIEFLVKRILPKVSFTKKYYFDITKGNDRLLSKAEGLGRLVSCGFKIMDYKSIDGILYFVVKKIKEPYFDESPSYGPLYKMPRIGKNGKIIGVYKFRTMHPFSEYLQDYMVNAYGYADSGKPANDFRIPNWGKFMRKFWLDELPQLYNVMKGEIKLVGIRPVSQRYFEDIPKEMQKMRLTQKPGCIPPYVSLNREGNVMSVLQAEKEYLVEKIENPFTTDIKFFFKAVYNIVLKKKRSA